MLKMFSQRILNAQKWPIRAMSYYIHIILLGETKLSLNRDDIGISNKLLINFFELPKEKIQLSENAESKYLKLKEELKNDETIKRILLSYYQIYEYFYRTFKHNKSNVYAEKAKEIDVNYKPIKNWTDFRKIEKEMRTLAKEKLYQKKNLQTFKISISISDFLAYISLFGTLFIISGYVYNYFYYKSFGFDVTPFFGLEDYLTTSIKAISNLVIGSILGVIAVYLGINSRLKVPEPAKAKEAKRINTERNLLIITLIVIAILTYIINKKQIFQIYYLVYILLIFSIVPKVAVRYFENGTKALFILIFFSYYIGAFTMNYLENTYSGNSKYERYEIKLNRKYKNLKVIGINTKYIFGKDTSTKNIIVIPITEMENIKIKPNRP